MYHCSLWWVEIERFTNNLVSLHFIPSFTTSFYFRFNQGSQVYPILHPRKFVRLRHISSRRFRHPDTVGTCWKRWVFRSFRPFPARKNTETGLKQYSRPESHRTGTAVFHTFPVVGSIGILSYKIRTDTGKYSFRYQYFKDSSLKLSMGSQNLFTTK
jgi:hypothetical protein